MDKTKYVAGLLFNHALTKVALIRKTKPDWQAGKLNGIGGKIEDKESPMEAMIREFKEETGAATVDSDWSNFMTMGGCRAGFTVHFFAGIGDLANLQSMEEEKVEIVKLVTINPIRSDMIENLCWIISMALDHLSDGRPSFADVTYSQA